MKDLAVGARPQDLVPGVPEEVEALADRLIVYADQAGGAAARLQAIDAGDWVGEAGDAFREAIGELPAKLERGSDAFWDAACALRAYAATLREAQATAARAIEIFTEGDCQTSAWAAQSDAYESLRRSERTGGGVAPGWPQPPTEDPGERLRAEARHLVERAQEEVEAAARRSAARLEDAGDAAPNKPGFFRRAISAAGDFGRGAVEGTVGMATFAFKLTPTYALVDPDGYVENLAGMGKGLAYGATHPIEFAKAVTDWDMWLDDPARALGQLVPELALALASAGAGGAAKGAGAARRVERAGDDLATLQRATGTTARLARAQADEWREVFTTTERQLQAKFKHASDFGVTGRFERATAAAFREAVIDHVKNPAHVVIEGKYRGNPAILYVNPDKSLVVIQKMDGRFLSGWRLSTQQLKYVLERGTLGGG